MAAEKPGEAQNLEGLLNDYVLCTVGSDHAFYVGRERPKAGLSNEEIARELRMSTDPGTGFCPEHYVRTGVNERNRDPATGRPTYQDYELAALELWQQVDKGVAETELAALEMGDIRVLNYPYVALKGDKKLARTAQAVAFPNGKYNAAQKKMILAMLLGEQQQIQEPEALVTLENRAKLGFELINGPAFLNGLLAAMNIAGYRLNPEDKTEVIYSGNDYTAEKVKAEVALAVTERRKAAEAGIRDIDRRIQAHMVLQLDALIKRAVQTPDTARQLSEALVEYLGIGRIKQ